MTRTPIARAPAPSRIVATMSVIATVMCALGCNGNARHERLTLEPADKQNRSMRRMSVQELQKSLEEQGLKFGEQVLSAKLPASWCTSLSGGGPGETFVSNIYIEDDLLVGLFWYSSEGAKPTLFAAFSTRVDRDTGDGTHGVTRWYGMDSRLWSAYMAVQRR